MRFTPCEWRYDNLRGWSPQRIAAAKRAVAREQLRTEAKRDEVALFPELAAEIQPAYSTVEERQEAMDKRELWLTRSFRTARAENWRNARAAYYSLPPIKREGMRRLWNMGIYPCDPAYFSEILRKHTKPGCSPWTYLRKRRLIVLWRDSILPKPADFQRITRSFDTL